MTPEQVFAVLDSHAVRLDPPRDYTVRGEAWYALAEVRGLRIEGEDYYARLIFDSAREHLVAVDVKTVRLDPSNSTHMYQALRQALTDKYGQPSLENEQDWLSKTTWMLDGTIIELQHVTFRSGGRVLNVWYEPRVAERNNGL